jgi:hypothetical protein
MKLIFVLLLFVTSVAIAQKADTIKLSPEGLATYNQFKSEQARLADEYQRFEVYKEVFRRGVFANKVLTAEDTIYFVEPDKFVVAKKKKPKTK